MNFGLYCPISVVEIVLNPFDFQADNVSMLERLRKQASLDSISHIEL